MSFFDGQPDYENLPTAADARAAFAAQNDMSQP